MTNSMDVIQVAYETTGKDGKKQTKTVSLQEFLGIDKENRDTFTMPQGLDETDQIKWEAIRNLYELNGREALYEKFPKREKTLTINLTHRGHNTESQGHFEPSDNTLDFGFDKGKNRDESIRLATASLAHETKHAQQFGKDLLAMMKKMMTSQVEDGLANHQWRYLSEAQAYALGGYVYAKLAQNPNERTGFLQDERYEKYKSEYAEIEKIHQQASDKATYKEMERPLMMAWLDVLFRGEANGYRDSYFKNVSIGKNDKGITFIPDSFSLQPQDVASLMDKVKKETPKTPTKRGLLRAQTKLLTTLTHILQSKQASGKTNQNTSSRAGR